MPGLAAGHLVDGAGVEDERPVHLVEASPVGVAVDDHVGLRELSAQPAAHAQLRPDQPEGQRGHQRDRLLQEARAIAVDHGDAVPVDLQQATPGEVPQPVVVIAAHGLDRRQLAQAVQRLGPAHVSGVEDQVHATQLLEDCSRELVEELGAVGVRDHADPHRRPHCPPE